ncbi:hypothetical protein SASPL_150794 [Salvia splendens]|uniref:Guanine nucleotide-binding protein subunit alpha, other n=1 Tax=Salvia splendens TaxID=180675 RepID=A0A8X8W841_SALSN|nr:hypothetical protein SASPL_150794 [Salvia splendens]
MVFVLCTLIDSMGSLCSRHRRSAADPVENEQTAEIERRIEQETKAEKHIQKLLLLGAGDSGKSTIFKQINQKDNHPNALQIKLLFQSGFDEAELKGYTPAIHANVYHTIKILYEGSKELSQSSEDSLKFIVSDENKEIGEKFSEIGGRLNYPCLTKEIAHEIETLWRDNAIQETYVRGNELQLPDCAHFFMENLQRLSDVEYVPTKVSKETIDCAAIGSVTMDGDAFAGAENWSAFAADTREADGQRACSGSRDGMAATNPRSRAGLGLAAEGTCPAGRRRHGPAAMSEQRRIGYEWEAVGQRRIDTAAANLCKLAVRTDNRHSCEDVLHARVRTTGVVEIQFSPVGENKKSGEVYRLFDVGGQKNERRKWIHLFEGVSAVIFCAAISEYDQTLFEDDNKNRMMETKELFEWILKQPCFEKTSFLLFLNKFDLFEKKVLKVPLNVCEWFKDYQPVSTGKQEIEHAYEFVKKKFEELYFQSTSPDRVDRVFKIYRTTALDQKLVKKTFKLVDETLRRRNLFEAGLL